MFDVTALLEVAGLHVRVGGHEILRGIDLEIPGLPPALRRQIDKAIEETSREAM